MTDKKPAPLDLEKLKNLDTCTASNAIERLNVRLRNEGFISGAVRCRFPDLPPMLGYAATIRIRAFRWEAVRKPRLKSSARPASSLKWK